MTNEKTREPGPLEQDNAETRPVKGPPQSELQVATLTDVGQVRTHNEDFVDFYIPPDPRQLERKGAIYLVADGMGGHQAGEVASQGAVELVIGQYYGDTKRDIGASLVRAFRAANQLIYDQAQADAAKAGMGTTLVAAVILGRKVYLANVGDSRAYLINAAGITQITEDHSWVEDQVRAGLLTREQAALHPQRNLVTRALGTKPDVEVDLFEGELGEGDILFLCSDGLTGRVEDHEIAAIVQEHPPQEAVRRLVALANERGGHDNITVLVVSDRDGTPTVAAPMRVPAPPPIQKKPAREFRLIPVLASIAAVLILVSGGALLAYILFGREPAPTPTTPVVTPTITLLPTTEPTPSVDVLQSPVETPTKPTATLVATFTATYTPLPPTNTPTLTSTPTLSPTTEVTLTGTSTLTVPHGPSDTPEPPTGTLTTSEPAPTLLEPQPDEDLSGWVTFQWDYPTLPLQKEKGFQFLVRKEGETKYSSILGLTNEDTRRINLNVIKPTRVGGPGLYHWTVVVLDRKTRTRISPTAEPRRFNYTGP